MVEQLLPSLGEGIESGTVVSILIKVGDTIEKEQSLIEVETDKVTMEVPSNYEGKVSKIRVKLGDQISVGEALFEIESEEHGVEEVVHPAEEAEAQIDSTENIEDPSETSAFPKNGIPQNPAIRRERKEGLRSTPKARKLARELGVGISTVATMNDVIVADDIKSHLRANHRGYIEDVPQGPASLPNFSKWGSTHTESMPAVMKATARNMMQSAGEIPHAWLQAEADITETEIHRKELNEYYGLKISLTVFIAKAVAKTLREYPKFNSSLNYHSQEIIFKDYVNIGVAVDTEHGLFVPVMKNVDQLSLSQIATTLSDLAERAKSKKLKMDELEGGNMTISNLGGFGTTAIFPIILPPQVAIIGVASFQNRDQRKYLPLTIGFDHRIIDGADAGRFLKRLVGYLKNPVNILA